MESNDLWTKVFADPLAKELLLPGIMVALTVPMRWLGQFLKWLPDTLFPPENIPLVLAAVGWVAAKILTLKFPVIPGELATLVAVGAGLGSKVAHDHSLAKKVEAAASGVWNPKTRTVR